MDVVDGMLKKSSSGIDNFSIYEFAIVSGFFRLCKECTTEYHSVASTRMCI
jgi:predicted metal-binding protein